MPKIHFREEVMNKYMVVYLRSCFFCFLAFSKIQQLLLIVCASSSSAPVHVCSRALSLQHMSLLWEVLVNIVLVVLSTWQCISKYFFGFSQYKDLSVFPTESGIDKFNHITELLFHLCQALRNWCCYNLHLSK